MECSIDNNRAPSRHTVGRSSGELFNHIHSCQLQLSLCVVGPSRLASSVYTHRVTLPVGDVIGRGVPSGMSCSTVVMSSQEVVTSCVGVGGCPCNAIWPWFAYYLRKVIYRKQETGNRKLTEVILNCYRLGKREFYDREALGVPLTAGPSSCWTLA